MTSSWSRPTARLSAAVLLGALLAPAARAQTRQTITELWEANRELLVSLGAGRRQQLLTLLWEGRHALVTAVLAGLVGQQLANDPGGHRWERLVDRTVDMLLAEVAPETLSHSGRTQ